MCKALAAKRKDRRDRKALQHCKLRRGKGSSEDVPNMDVHKHPVLPYELLLKISADLHFIDLINASRSSKRLRTTLFGVGGPGPSQLEDLQRFTCQGNTKRSCDLCGIQICPNCQTLVGSASPLASLHLKNCQPQCSRCFYNTYCRWWGPQGQRLAKHSTACGLSEQQQADIEMGVVAGPEGPVPAFKAVCRMCASMTPTERRRAFQAKDEKELDRMERQPLACSKCKEMLPARAMRWWICQICLTECPFRMHPAWADRSLP
ncbi:hypothetical protein P885DRAFT_45659 [Corynascus similis CBS 632.67]